MPSEDLPSAEAGAPQVDDIPSNIAGFQVERRLGRGAFAEVFLACDDGTLGQVALKVLRRDLDPSIARQIRTRFLLEERIANAIPDPRIVKVLATSAPGDDPCFIAMEYVDGLPFTEWFARLRGKRSSALDAHLRELARLGHEVACAMAAAHSRGVVHRDLKPENVLISGRPQQSRPATVKIVDFGIAKAPLELLRASREPTLTPHRTELGTVMGSPPYMAPEQNGAAHAVTGKADVFALGIMLTITALGLDPDTASLCQASFILPDDFERALAMGPPLPDEWRLLLERLVQEDPDARPDMHDAAIELQRLAQADHALAEAVYGWVRRGRVPERKRLAALLAGSYDEARLTADERAFLREAPVRVLKRSRPLLGLLTLSALGLSAASTWAWQRDGERFGYLQARLRAERADAAREQAEAQRALQAREVEKRALVARVNGAISEADAEKMAAAKARESRAEERAAQCKALASSLAECSEQRQKMEKSAQRRIDELTRELEAERRARDDRASGEAHCQRELETRVAELGESRNRLRLCSDSLRARRAPKSAPLDESIDAMEPDSEELPDGT